MNIEIYENFVNITREEGDKPIKNESQLLYHIKKYMNENGYKMVKKLMYKDKHMVPFTQHYLKGIVSSTTKMRPCWQKICVYDNNYVIRNSAKDYNTYQTVTFILKGLQ